MVGAGPGACTPTRSHLLHHNEPGSPTPAKSTTRVVTRWPEAGLGAESKDDDDIASEHTRRCSPEVGVCVHTNTMANFDGICSSLQPTWWCTSLAHVRYRSYHTRTCTLGLDNSATPAAHAPRRGRRGGARVSHQATPTPVVHQPRHARRRRGVWPRTLSGGVHQNYTVSRVHIISARTRAHEHLCTQTLGNGARILGSGAPVAFLPGSQAVP